MRFLLDTHVVLWWINGDKKISKEIKKKIEEADEVYVSSASIWEMVIKIRLGKLKIDVEAIVEVLPQSGFIELPISIRHTAKVVCLPNLHRDPFDRILIAQALVEPLILLTADPILVQYSDLVELV